MSALVGSAAAVTCHLLSAERQWLSVGVVQTGIVSLPIAGSGRRRYRLLFDGGCLFIAK